MPLGTFSTFSIHPIDEAVAAGPAASRSGTRALGCGGTWGRAFFLVGACYFPAVELRYACCGVEPSSVRSAGRIVLTAANAAPRRSERWPGVRAKQSVCHRSKAVARVCVLQTEIMRVFRARAPCNAW